MYVLVWNLQNGETKATQLLKEPKSFKEGLLVKR